MNRKLHKIPSATLKKALWRKAALQYEKAGRPEDGAAAWLAAGRHRDAARIYEKTGQWERLTQLLLELRDFPAAGRSAERWLEDLQHDPGRRSGEEIRALLARAASLQLTGDPQAGTALYRQARTRLEKTGSSLPPLLTGRNWEALALYGDLVLRPDLMRLGYETALMIYDPLLPLERERCLREYLDRAAADPFLTAELNERLAAWTPLSTLKQERENLFQALARFNENDSDKY
jgi:hypothetical protein